MFDILGDALDRGLMGFDEFNEKTGTIIKGQILAPWIGRSGRPPTQHVSIWQVVNVTR